MAEPNKVDINFSAETGKASAEVRNLQGTIEATGPSGQRAAATITGTFRTVESAAKKMRRALGMVSFGTMWVDAVTNIAGKFREWREEARKAAVEAQKAANEAEFTAQTRAVEGLAERYRRLAADIRDAAAAARDAEREAAASLDAARSLEDAQLQLREEREVAAIDRSDPAYAEKVREVRQRYAGARGVLGAERAVEDAEAKRKSYERESFDEDARAESFAKNAKSARDEEGEMRRRADLWSRLAEWGKAAGGEDWADRLAGTAKSGRIMSDFFKAGGDQSYMEAIKGMTPAEVAEYAKEQSAKFAERAGKAGETARQFEGRAAESAARSRTSGALAESQDVAVSAAKVRREAAATSRDTSRADAEGAVEKAEREARERAEEAGRRAEEEKSRRRAEEEKRASALAAQGNLSRERGEVRDRIAEEQSKKDAASRRVFDAQGALDLARANGDAKGAKAAGAALAEAKESALNVNAAADRAIADLTATLKGIEERLSAASRYLRQQQGQSNYAWAEAPSGN